jgi:hypothetical protein
VKCQLAVRDGTTERLLGKIWPQSRRGAIAVERCGQYGNSQEPHSRSKLSFPYANIERLEEATWSAEKAACGVQCSAVQQLRVEPGRLPIGPDSTDH